MSKINVLEKNVAELIAAGEVIERPASIVKELLENSIDAGATAITVEIKNGGITYLRITDNGCGIEKDDVKVAFLRHATSKITFSHDLDSIGTLGFRGEALASICAVSKVEMITKTKEQQFGTRIIIEGSEQKMLDSTGCPDGTTIVVRELFYNVPARLKFLKKDVSEANVIASIIDKIALSHPQISFKLISDNKVKLHTPGNGELIGAIYSVFGKEFASTLIKVDYEYQGIKVTGYACNPSSSRANRSMQNFFVNTRYVKSKTCVVALEEAYKNCILTGKFPSCVLDVAVGLDTVDVNVHPAKIEIRFINERVVFDAIYFAVKSALTANDTLTMASTPNPYVASTFKSQQHTQINIFQAISQKEKSADEKLFINNIKLNVSDNKPKITVTNQNNDKPTLPLDQDDGLKDFKFINKQNTKVVKPNKPVIHLEQIQPDENDQHNDIDMDVDVKKTFSNELNIEPIQNKENKPVCDKDLIDDKRVNINDICVKVVGEIFNTYFLFEVEQNLIMVDKHAAHERIIFEKLKLSVKTEDRQVMIAPQIITVSKPEFLALMANKDKVLQMGFVYDEFGNNTIAVREVPTVLDSFDVKDIILDIAQKLIDNKRDISSDVYEDLLHSIACRSAIKANDKTSVEELVELVKIIYNNDEIRYCPHGRPVVVSMSKYEIEKKFKRV